MDIRRIRTGTRLAFAFGLLLLAALMLLAALHWSESSSTQRIVSALEQSARIESQVAELNAALLASAVAVRNMALESSVEGVQKQERIARQHEARFRALLAELKTGIASDEDRQLLAALETTASSMSRQFREAVSQAAMMMTDQAMAIIRDKVDPLLDTAMSQTRQLTQQQTERAASRKQQAEEALRYSLLLIAGLVVAVLAGAGLMAWHVARSLTVPLDRAVLAAAEVAQGNLAAAIDGAGVDEAARLMAGLAHMRDSLAGMVRDVRQGAQAIANASGEIASGIADLSIRTEQQASALQQTAGTMKELGAIVEHNADSAQRANQLAVGASTIAMRGGEVVGTVVSTMQEISESSAKIADIISVIDGIAFQTNILALNAAVEAARAGEQGRGFAVVAGEVRTLAQRSAEAARQIKALITDSVERVGQGAGLVNSAGATMAKIVVAINEVAEVIAQISSASAQQSAGFNRIGQTMAQMDRNTQQNSALVEQGAAAAESLHDQVRQLVSTVAVFRLGEMEAAPEAETTPAARAATKADSGSRAETGAAPNAEAAPPELST